MTRRDRLPPNVHHVPLANLPADVVIPECYRERYWYDAQQRRLCFIGFMSKATHSKLESLSQDGQYQNALADLFRICVPEEAESKSGPVKAAVALVAAIGAVGVGVAAWLMLAH